MDIINVIWGKSVQKLIKEEEDEFVLIENKDFIQMKPPLDRRTIKEPIVRPKTPKPIPIVKIKTPTIKPLVIIKSIKPISPPTPLLTPGNPQAGESAKPIPTPLIIKPPPSEPIQIPKVLSIREMMSKRPAEITITNNIPVAPSILRQEFMRKK